MHTKNYLVFLSLIFSSFIFAQTPLNYIIRGKVSDAEGVGLEFATISAYALQDSSLVGGVLTESGGVFTLDILSKEIYLVAEYLGYEKKMVQKLTWSSNIADAGTIVLTGTNIALETVEVVARKNETQFALDKRVFNVGQDLSNKGGNAVDILDNVPSVTVDIDGGVSLRGSSNVRILIDGRPSGLLGNDGSTGLKSIPASMIDRVEVITNPSARYEAEGMSGIINIVLKKDAKIGVNGSFDLSSGYPLLFGTSANVNWRRKNVNFFANYALNHNTNPADGYAYQERYSAVAGSPITATHIVRDGSRNTLSNSIRGGIDYTLSPKDVLTGSVLFRYSLGNSLIPVHYYDYTFLPGQERDRFLIPTNNYTLRKEEEKETSPTLEYAINYKRSFSRENESLTASFQFSQNDEKEVSDYDESYYLNRVLENNIVKQKTTGDEKQGNIVFQADYVLPVNKNTKFEAGLRSGIRNIGNDFLVEQLINGEWNVLQNLSNRFTYHENVEALYAIFGSKTGRFSYQGGLRGEYTYLKTALVNSGEEYPRDFFQLFPSGHINYEFPDQNQLQLSYSRRIRRPGFWELNPFINFTDSRNLYAGNPNLNPETTDSYELGHMKFWEKGNIGTSLYYRNTKDVIQRWREFKDDGTSFAQPLNLASSVNYGGEFLFAYTANSWLRVDGNVNFFRNTISGFYKNTDLSADSYSWFSRIGTRLSFWKNTDFQLRFNYRAPVRIPQGWRKEQYIVDIAFNKDFFNNNMSFTLAARDLLNYRRQNIELGGEGFDFYERSEQQWRRAPVIATLSYRLNSAKKKSGRNDGEGFENGPEI